MLFIHWWGCCILPHTEDCYITRLWCALVSKLQVIPCWKWSQTEDEDTDGLLTFRVHESVDNPAVLSPGALLCPLPSKRWWWRGTLTAVSEGMIAGHQEHFLKEKKQQRDSSMCSFKGPQRQIKTCTAVKCILYIQWFTKFLTGNLVIEMLHYSSNCRPHHCIMII